MNNLDRSSRLELRRKITGVAGSLVATLIICVIMAGFLHIAANLATALYVLKWSSCIVTVTSLVFILHYVMYAYFDFYAVTIEWLKYPATYLKYKHMLRQIKGVSDLEARIKALEALKHTQRPGFAAIIDRLICLTDKRILKLTAKADAEGQRAYENTIRALKKRKDIKGYWVDR